MSSRTSAPSTAAMRVIIVESSQRNAVWLGVSGSSVAPGSLMRGERATGVVEEVVHRVGSGRRLLWSQGVREGVASQVRLDRTCLVIRIRRAGRDSEREVVDVLGGVRRPVAGGGQRRIWRQPGAVVGARCAQLIAGDVRVADQNVVQAPGAE